MALFAAIICFGSFGWGMARHFRRSGPATSTLLAVALCAFISAGLTVFALARRATPHPVPAICLYLVSAAIFWWAVSVSRDKLAACGHQSISNAVIAIGPFRFVRHPCYAAYNLAWLAGFVATEWWPLALSTLAMAALYESCARAEESNLLAGSLAQSYRTYARRTGRYVPGVGLFQ